MAASKAFALVSSARSMASDASSSRASSRAFFSTVRVAAFRMARFISFARFFTQSPALHHFFRVDRGTAMALASAARVSSPAIYRCSASIRLSSLTSGPPFIVFPPYMVTNPPRKKESPPMNPLAQKVYNKRPRPRPQVWNTFGPITARCFFSFF